MKGPRVQDLAEWSPPQPATQYVWSIGILDALVKVELSAALLPGGGVGTSAAWSRGGTCNSCTCGAWLEFGGPKGLPGCTPHQDVLFEMVPPGVYSRPQAMRPGREPASWCGAASWYQCPASHACQTLNLHALVAIYQI